MATLTLSFCGSPSLSCHCSQAMIALPIKKAEHFPSHALLALTKESRGSGMWSFMQCLSLINREIVQSKAGFKASTPLYLSQVITMHSIKPRWAHQGLSILVSLAKLICGPCGPIEISFSTFPAGCKWQELLYTARCVPTVTQWVPLFRQSNTHVLKTCRRVQHTERDVSGGGWGSTVLSLL